MSQSYIPLYRKYRPQTFADLVGQEVVSKALCNAIEMGKISHAYLFTGSRGTGKTSAARILAKSLNCIEGPTATPCGKCANCIDITNGSAIDVKEIDAASNNGVEDARDIIEKVQFVPVSGKYKIFIIDEVHMLSNAAFNTLLKTLEEPPKNLVFILATTESHKVLETIVSRCQRFDFRKIKTADIIKRLEYIAKQEKIKIAKEAVELIAQKSSGGLRDAIALLDQASVLGLGGNEISVDDILSISGAISQDDLYAITSALAAKQPDVLISLIKKIISQGNEPLLVLQELVGYFRNLLLVKTVGDASKVADLLAVSEKALGQLNEQAQGFETTEIAQIIEKLAEYEVMLKNTTNQIMWIEVILISILHRQDIKVIKDLEKRVSALEAAISSGQVPKTVELAAKTYIQSAPKAQPSQQPTQQPSPQPEIQETAQSEIEEFEIKKTESQKTISEPKPSQQEPSMDDNLQKTWISLLNTLESFPAKSFFNGLAKPVKISETELIIALSNESLIKGAKESRKLQELEAAANKFFGKEVRVNLITFAEKSEIKKKLKQGPEIKNEPELLQENAEFGSDEENLYINIDPPEEILVERPIEKSEKANFSDSAEMLIELFQGKIIE